jgi:hypothetical protein
LTKGGDVYDLKDEKDLGSGADRNPIQRTNRSDVRIGENGRVDTQGQLGYRPNLEW